MFRQFSVFVATIALLSACGGEDGEETTEEDTATDVVLDTGGETPDTLDDAEQEAGEDIEADIDDVQDTVNDDVQDTSDDAEIEPDGDQPDGDQPDGDQPDGDESDGGEPDITEPDVSEDVAADATVCTTSGRVSFEDDLELWTRVGEPLPTAPQAATVLEPFCGDAQVLSDVSWLTGEWTEEGLLLEYVGTPPAGLHEASLTLVDSGVGRVAGRLDIVRRALPQLRPDMTPHVLWIGIDGMRSDAHYSADTPTMDRLRDSGAWTYDGTTHLSTSTDSSAGWTSLLTGVESDKHLVLNNGTLAARDWSWPTTTQMARDAGFETAVYAHWAPVTDDIHEATSMTRQGNGSDDAIRDQAVAELLRSGEEATAQLLVLHLDDVDHAGHGTGFTALNPNYITEIEAQDARIAVVLDVLLSRPTLESEDWMVFVVTDHGGEGTSHGAQNVPNWRIPFLQWGTRVAPGRFDDTVSHMDVAPTVLAHLGIASALEFDGQPMGNISRTPGARPPTVEATCDDRIDEDGDRLFDCNDPDCDAAEVCEAVCADREAVGTSGIIASGNNADETTDYSLTCARLPGGRDVGVSFVAPLEGTYRFDTVGTDFDTILAVYEGECATPSAQLACDDDGAGDLLSQVDIALTAGQEVTVVVAGFDSRSGDWVLNANLLE